MRLRIDRNSLFYVVQVCAHVNLSQLYLTWRDRAPGNIVDYMYAKAGIKFSYAVHLRDTGTVRFVRFPFVVNTHIPGKVWLPSPS